MYIFSWQKLFQTLALEMMPRLNRKSIQKKELLNGEQKNDDAIKPQLDLLERSRREDQFFALSNIIIENWRARGESEYAD
ncbi:hypothetical protein PHMEG_00010422 [Phytophthora megakarya]|uniref:Uncharacterized protein n=1 Tax=Phytophthora megakarya TaxID=4795 RepID=A0A225WE34_9STRA|nr:hypothetical protein PHMEG_00010422 [Phytophthora megakarya]